MYLKQTAYKLPFKYSKLHKFINSYLLLSKHLISGQPLDIVSLYVVAKHFIINTLIAIASISLSL